MRYHQKRHWGNLRIIVYLCGFGLICYAAMVTHNLYKINNHQLTNCAIKVNSQISVSGPVRQVLPIDPNTAMIISSTESGNTKVMIYDHCTGSVQREFVIYDSTQAVAN